MIVFAYISLILVENVLANNMTAEEIIQKMSYMMNPMQSEGKSQMTIITSSGQERTFVYENYMKNNGEKILMKYLEPKRVKGQSILMLNNADDIWTYFPRTKRVRKLATHSKKQKMEGSDFSYEDMGSGNSFIDEFDSKLLDEEKMEDNDCYKLELTRKKDSSSSYSRLIIWIDKENFVPLIIDYYDDKNPNLWEKRLVCSDIRLIEDIPTPMKMIMYNKMDNTQTTMEMLEVRYNIELDDELFTERGMQR